MTATQLSPVGRAAVDAVRAGLADVGKRVSEIEAMLDWDAIGELPGQLVDRATGRRRRPSVRLPLLALGVVAVAVLAIRAGSMAMARDSWSGDADKRDDDTDPAWHAASRPVADVDAFDEANAQSFPASDPMSTPASPSISPG